MLLMPHRLLIATAVLAMVGLYTALALWYPLGYIWATYEDLYGEWSQTYLFAIAGALFVRLAFFRTRHWWFAAVMAAACFYVFLEEISWGQRIFGFASPEFFSRNNLQGETNLHNFFTGPYATLLKDVIRWAVAIGLIIYGLVLPLALRGRVAFVRWLESRGVIIPPPSLAVVFILAAVLELRPFGFNEAEIAELLVAFALAATAAYGLVTRRRSIEAAPDSAMGPIESKAFAWRLAIILGVTAVLAVATTTALYASPAQRARIDRRIDNGIERFAARYSRYGRWDIVIGLYERLLEDKPENSFLLRSIARAQREKGDESEFERYASRAIEVELVRYESEPWRASVLRSLVRGYRLIGDENEASRYLALAIDLGLTRVAEHPDSANAAYSLGRTYALAGLEAEALEQYARAYDLEPSSGRFRQAYLAARSRQ